MKKKISLVIALTTAMTSFAASATDSNLGYTNVELGYAQQAINDGWSSHYSGYLGSSNALRHDTRLKGGYVSGSIELGKAPLYAFGSYAQGAGHVSYHSWGQSNWAGSWDDRYSESVRAKEFTTGLGYYYGFNPNTNLIAELSYVHQRTSSRWEDEGTVHHDSNGGRVSVGYDSMLASKLEGWVKASYTNLKNDGANGIFSGAVGLQYKITPMWGVTAQAEFAKVGDHDESHQAATYKMGVRASF